MKEVIKIIPISFAWGHKTGINLMIYHFDIHGKLSIIQCKKNNFLPCQNEETRLEQGVDFSPENGKCFVNRFPVPS